MSVLSKIGEPSIVMSSRPAQLRKMRKPREIGEERKPALGHILDHRQIAALGVGIVAVEIAAEHEAAFVRLADIEMAGAERHHMIDQRLDAFGDEGLDDMRLDRQPQAGKRADPRGAAGDGKPHLRGADEAAVGLDAFDARPARCGSR